MNKLGLAIALASEVHANQTDKAGKPYILHPLRVMNRLNTEDSELMQAAVLHDAVEDAANPENVATVIVNTFSERVIVIVNLCTHDPDDSYETYIRKIATNQDAIRVKMADLEDNSDITRLKGVTEKDLARIAEYHKAYTFLKSVRH